MSKKGSKKSAERARATEAKKAAVLGKDKKTRRIPLIIAAICLFIAAGAAVIVTRGTKEAVSRVTSLGETATSVALPVELFEGGKARYYQHTTKNGQTIRFFVLKSSDGVIRAAFDACDVCWPANKGYAQDGDYMVCRNCGRRFASVKVNEVRGGCNPAPLKRRIENGRVIIDKADILDGLRFFDFAKVEAASPAGPGRERRS